ncbi:MAG: glucan biosynthesis protein G [Acetobacteraceae bacterium]
MQISRRVVLQGAATLAGAGRVAAAEPFSAETVRRLARDLAAKPYRAPAELPAAAGSLSYDQYRNTRFRPEQALWRGLPFQIQFFPRGFLYRGAVEVFEVADGQALPVAFSPDQFEGEARLPEGLGFAGFRIHAEINRPGSFEECCVFLGASYFRAVGRNGFYGLSARGLALGTGRPEPEEFPTFRSFWLERPQPGASSLVVNALLDSPSVTGAFRFSLRPGETTRMDVEAALFPRVTIADWGLAPLTSMYLYSARDRNRSGPAADWRTGVHDSDGLAVLTGRGERLWRPLVNPAAVQFSGFGDSDPRGFGLLQRRRDFQAFGDLQVLYGRRPSAWVEPIGGWGLGAVGLVEIPTGTEYQDNIVAFWRGRDPLRAGARYSFAYRLHWGEDAPLDKALARLEQMRTGIEQGRLVFVLDFGGDTLRGLPETAPTRLELTASAGRLIEGFSGPNPETGGWRVSLELDPAGATAAELRCTLLGERGPLAETWLYRWTA